MDDCHEAVAIQLRLSSSGAGMQQTNVAGAGADPAADKLVEAPCITAGPIEADEWYLRAAAIAEIVGTLAGEDTIFIAVHDQKEQRAATKKIWEMFG